jgi:poly-gamma-glutamate synthesis protein (capsule biosynthesis protein)
MDALSPVPASTIHPGPALYRRIVVTRDDPPVLDFRRLAVVLLVPAVVIVAVQVRSSEADMTAIASGVRAQVVATTTTAAPAPAASAVTVAVSGELLPHPSIVEFAGGYGAASGRAYDFAPLFADVSPPISAADLAICHLEVPVAPPGAPLSGYPSFAIPAEIGDGIQASGWDRCSTASNHSNDKGTGGIEATLDALDAAQVDHSGTARTAGEAAVPGITEVKGVGIAHLSYTWGFNGAPPSEPWMANVTDPDRILADAQQARAAGAEIVILSLHWGNEYDPAGSADQRSLAGRLLASPDIDLIVGHGPHVLQPIEMIHGKYVLLSVGNLVANQGKDRPSTYDGVIATVTFSMGDDGRFHAAAPVVEPTWYDRHAGRVRLVNAALADPGLAGLHSDLTASLTRTQAILDPYVAAN